MNEEKEVIDEFVKILYDQLNRIELTAGMVKQDLDKGIIQDSERLIPINKVLEIVNGISIRLEYERRDFTPKTKFLCVEDGSVDVDELSETLYTTNPEIKVVVYRAGGAIPVIKEVE